MQLSLVERYLHELQTLRPLLIAAVVKGTNGKIRTKSIPTHKKEKQNNKHQLKEQRPVKTRIIGN